MTAKEDEYYTNNQRAWRWVIYTALPSIFTYILAIAYDYILGYKITQSLSNHFLEFILMVFAISFSIYGSAANIEQKISKKRKEVFSGISVTCCFACLVFYGFLYYISKQEAEHNTITINSNAVIFIRIFFILIATMIIYSGFYFESKGIESEINNAPENEKNNEEAKNEQII